LVVPSRARRRRRLNRLHIYAALVSVLVAAGAIALGFSIGHGDGKAPPTGQSPFLRMDKGDEARP
jgi:hypothetical protein